MPFRLRWVVLGLLVAFVLGGLGFLFSRWRFWPELARQTIKASVLHTLCGHETPVQKVDRRVLAVLAGRSVGARYAGWELVTKGPQGLSLRTARRDLCPRCRRLRFLGVADGVVAVYEGTPAHPGRVLERTAIRVEALPLPEQTDLRRGIPFADAKERLQLLEGLAALVGD
ncbi:MAG: BofC C-terminal domain-containing protein [Bacillota bacterium]